MTGDLHCHTRYSDGSDSPEAVVLLAKRAGLHYLSVTDHDTMAAYPQLAELGKKQGITVIPGVELSCIDLVRGRRVHLLCYFPEQDHPALLQVFEGLRSSRRTSGEKCIELLSRHFPVAKETYYTYTTRSTTIYKPHLMHALMDAGIADCIYGELYHKLFTGPAALCRTRNTYTEIYTALDVVRQAGGAAVLAHPYVYDSIDLLEELAGKGLLSGVEVFHPSCKGNRCETLTAAADRYGLIKTGGSDYHGLYASRSSQVGQCRTPMAEIRRLIQAAGME